MGSRSGEASSGEIHVVYVTILGFFNNGMIRYRVCDVMFDTNVSIAVIVFSGIVNIR